MLSGFDNNVIKLLSNCYQVLSDVIKKIIKFQWSENHEKIVQRYSVYSLQNLKIIKYHRSENHEQILEFNDILAIFFQTCVARTR